MLKRQSKEFLSDNTHAKPGWCFEKYSSLYDLFLRKSATFSYEKGIVCVTIIVIFVRMNVECMIA